MSEQSDEKPDERAAAATRALRKQAKRDRQKADAAEKARKGKSRVDPRVLAAGGLVLLSIGLYGWFGGSAAGEVDTLGTEKGTAEAKKHLAQDPPLFIIHFFEGHADLTPIKDHRALCEKQGKTAEGKSWDLMLRKEYKVFVSRKSADALVSDAESLEGQKAYYTAYNGAVVEALKQKWGEDFFKKCADEALYYKGK